MRTISPISALFASLLIGVLALPPGVAWADPCGMVPPIFTGPGPAIARIGVQQTYVFHKDGVETFVIRPGFSGRVEEFGMLIPFPTPPAIRKVPDAIFPHIAAAIDPPEVVVDLRLTCGLAEYYGFGQDRAVGLVLGNTWTEPQTVTVLKQEAIGMYEVAVLEAGSASALRAWMEEHGYRYPDGMDGVCDEYVADGWCFVAIKTRVGRKQGVDPRPGMRDTDSGLEPGQSFIGHVQAMGFRFRSDELVLPMRLSTFNEGDLHNIVYVLADDPQRIRDIDTDMIVRQLPGEELYRNLTQSLPLRVHGGTQADIPGDRLARLPAERDPRLHNGYARDLFAADLISAGTGRLSHPFEEREKQLLAISERLGLRGEELDAIHHEALATERQRQIDDALVDLRDMTLTVIDGTFPREVLSRDNLRFDAFAMGAANNKPEKYDAKRQGPAVRRGGLLFWETGPGGRGSDSAIPTILLLIGALLIAGSLGRRAWRTHPSRVPTVLLAAVLLTVFAIGSGAVASSRCFADAPLPAQVDAIEAQLIQVLIAQLDDPATAETAVEKLCRLGGTPVHHALAATALGDGDLIGRGWAIVGLAELDDRQADDILTRLLADSSTDPLVRLWAATGRVRIAPSVAKVLRIAPLASDSPALQRPIAKRLNELLATGPSSESVDALLEFTTAAMWRLPVLDLSDVVLSLGADPLLKALAQSPNPTARRSAAAFLATLGTRDGGTGLAKSVIDTYRFQPAADVEPWADGPLFVPSLGWSREDARALAEELLSWHLWADRHGRIDLERPIHAALTSLARAAGYPSPRFQDVDIKDWLAAWGRAYGAAAVERLLVAQGVEDSPLYADVLGSF